MNILNTTDYEMYNPSVINANNCTLTDVNGKLYYDFEAGVWALPLGHNHPRINKVITNQLTKISHVGYRYSDPVVEKAAEELLRIMRFDKGKCLFLSSGSEAVEFAVKAVQKLSEKPYLLKLGKHYLSAYGLSGDQTNDRWISVDWQTYLEQEIGSHTVLASVSKGNVSTDSTASQDVAAAVENKLTNEPIIAKGDMNSKAEEEKVSRYNPDEAIFLEELLTDFVTSEKVDLPMENASAPIDIEVEDLDISYDRLLKDIPFDRIGAFVFEPGNTSGTAKLPPKKLIEAIAEHIKDHDGFIVVDEVTSGMGRTGKWFGYEHYKLKPDLIACGKGLGNGYPVSAVGMKKEVAELLEQSGFLYAQSHQNDPMGCAIAKEVISTLRDEALVKKAAELGVYFRGELNKLKEKHSCIKEVRGVGLMLVMEMTGVMNEMIGKSTRLTYIHKQLYASGFIVGLKPAANLFRFYAPLTIEKYMIDDLIFNLDHILPYSAEIG